MASIDLIQYPYILFEFQISHLMHTWHHLKIIFESDLVLSPQRNQYSHIFVCLSLHQRMFFKLDLCLPILKFLRYLNIILSSKCLLMNHIHHCTFLLFECVCINYGTHVHILTFGVDKKYSPICHKAPSDPSLSFSLFLCQILS